MSATLRAAHDIENDGSHNVAICEIFVDTAADLAGLDHLEDVYFLQGSEATDIDTGDKYLMQSNGTWKKQPTGSAFENVYTKSEVDTIVSNINSDISDAENDISDLHAGLTTIINSGGKNKMPVENGGVTSGRWVDIAVNIPAGSYRVSFGSVTSTDTDSTTCQILFFDSAFSQVSNTVQMSRGNNVSSPVTISGTATTMRIYSASSYAFSAGDTMQFTQGMVCEKSLWDISPAFSPYCPTLAELYALVRSYHP